MTPAEAADLDVEVFLVGVEQARRHAASLRDRVVMAAASNAVLAGLIVLALGLPTAGVS